MYNLNVSLSAPLLGVGPSTVSCTTPRTPEILNSVIAMTNPMDTYQQQLQQQQQHHQLHQPQITAVTQATVVDSGAVATAHQQQQQQFESLPPQILTNEASMGSNSDSSQAVTPTEHDGTLSVKKTRSQLIKDGLKLTIESKRKQSVGDSSGNETSRSNRKDTITSMYTSDEVDEDEQCSPKNGLTPEDEERRRRRRERNKVAATKCRNKKRQRTILLVTESEMLEKQNTDLKDQERKLEKEIHKLMEALKQHSTNCVVPGGYQAPPLPNRTSGCCSAQLTTIKTEPVAIAPTTGRGRRANGTRGRAASGRGGGGGRAGRKAVKQEPIESPVQGDKSILPNILSSIQLPHFPVHTDPFYSKYNAMDESPSQDFYSYDATLTSTANALDTGSNCANYLLKSPTTSVDSMNTATLNDLSNGSTFSYPLATPISITNGGGGGGVTGGGGNGILLHPSPLLKNDIYIPNCENSNDLLQCANPVVHNLQATELYHDIEADAKLHEMNLNGNGVNNLSCYDDAPLFSVFC